jgi:hypothetical protein
MKVNCQCCNKEIEKRECDIKRTKHNFCTRSCANKILRRKTRTKTKKCRHCDNLILSNRQKCEFCIKNFRFILDQDKLSEVIYKNHHKSSAFALIRTRARAIAKTLGWKSCKRCGYDKHIEICHIKAIKDFSPDALVSEINDVSNLLPLCPNCHWEHDNIK